MRMPTKASSLLTGFALLAGASLMTACSGGGVTGPQTGSSLKPAGRAESGYVVAERDSVESLTRTTGDLLDMTFQATTEVTTTTTTTVSTIGKKLLKP